MRSNVAVCRPSASTNSQIARPGYGRNATAVGEFTRAEYRIHEQLLDERREHQITLRWGVFWMVLSFLQAMIALLGHR